MCNRCDATVDYLPNLNRALSGNPYFDGKCREICNEFRKNHWYITAHIIESSYHREIFTKFTKFIPKTTFFLGKDDRNTDH